VRTWDLSPKAGECWVFWVRVCGRGSGLGSEMVRVGRRKRRVGRRCILGGWGRGLWFVRGGGGEWFGV